VVDLEEIGGQPHQIREQGLPPDVPENAALNDPLLANPASDDVAPPGDFYNPYNFIPALPRDNRHPALDDALPIGHDRYWNDRWTGQIQVTLKAETPLLLRDPNTVMETSEHKTHQTKLDLNGRPAVAPEEIRGMLRSAYEAVTNSRLAIFAEHEDRLAYRMAAGDGLELVPARIEAGQIRLLLGTTPNTPTRSPQGRWQIPGNLMYAAWLPRYWRDPHTGGLAVAPHAVRYPGGALPLHGEAAWAWLEKYQRGNTFCYWRVRKITSTHAALGAPPGPGPTFGRHSPIGEPLIQVSGFVVVTNPNIDRKHDERFFFSQTVRSVSLEEEHRQAWRNLICNYQDEHLREIAQGLPGPPALRPGCVWSRHVQGRHERELSDGTLCYARVRTGAGRMQVTDLFPVMIARELFASAPANLLHPSLHPATSLTQLSPADRVFGWSHPDGNGSYKGQLETGRVECLTPTEQAIEDWGGQPVPLQILGQPKPQQGRFYAAQDQSGLPVRERDKSRGYVSGRGLRGRKVYPHHAGLPRRYWANPVEDRTQTGMEASEGVRFQEYRRPMLDGNEQQDSQNSSILDWVRPGTEFTVELRVINLSAVELGALLWLLQLPPDHFHKLGGGKPLGFGSIRMGVSGTALGIGQDWREYYSALDSKEPSRDPKDAVQAFREAIATAYGGDFTQVSFIRAFEKAAVGFSDKPTHYPRVGAPGSTGPVAPSPKGENFLWFTENERKTAPVSLDPLILGNGLPYYNEPE